MTRPDNPDDDPLPDPTPPARRGIGKEVIRLLIEHARSRPGRMRELSTSYVPGPGCPGPFYETLGFSPTGEIDDGEVVLAYPLGGGVQLRCGVRV